MEDHGNSLNPVIFGRRTLIRGTVAVAAAFLVPRKALATGGIVEGDTDVMEPGATPPPLSVRPMPGDVVRVLIARGKPSVQMSAVDGFAVFDAMGSSTPIIRANPGQTIELDVNVVARGSGGVFVEAAGDGPLRLDGRPYRGRFIVMAESNGLMVVNQLRVDLYVLGVLGREISPQWPAAALQAHAIVSRTYALASRKDATHAYDLVATTADQVYGGMTAESPPGNDAVYQTRGRVLSYNGGIASVYFHSCCGGHTEDAAAVWGRDIPYLQGVPDPYCAGAPHYRWRSYVTTADLRQRLSTQLGGVGEINRLQPSDIDASGRAKIITVEGEGGQCEIPAHQFRMRIGTSLVRSTLIHRIQVANGPDRLQPDPAYDDPAPAPPTEPLARGPLAMLEGAGWGHGVGMCQWGARGLALKGGTAEQILGLYFRGASVMQLGRA